MAIKMPICVTIVLITSAAPVSACVDEVLGGFKRHNYATIPREWQPLAMQGHTLARYNFGVLYQNGRGVPQDHTGAGLSPPHHLVTDG